MNKCKNKNSTIKNNHIYPLILFIYYCSANFKVILFFFPDLDYEEDFHEDGAFDPQTDVTDILMKTAEKAQPAENTQVGFKNFS